MLVPDKVRYELLVEARVEVKADTMSTPGANTSTHWPKLLHGATWSLFDDAPLTKADAATLDTVIREDAKGRDSEARFNIK